MDSSDATTKAEQASIALQQAQRSYDKTADRQYVRAEVAGVVSADVYKRQGVHGANRLGGNAVADFTVFGRIAGKAASDYAA